MSDNEGQLHTFFVSDTNVIEHNGCVQLPSALQACVRTDARQHDLARYIMNKAQSIVYKRQVAWIKCDELLELLSHRVSARALEPLRNALSPNKRTGKKRSRRQEREEEEEEFELADLEEDDDEDWDEDEDSNNEEEEEAFIPNSVSIESLTVIVNALCNIYNTVADEPLRARIRVHLGTFEHQVSTLFDQPANDRVRVNERIRELYPGTDVSLGQMAQIGKRAAALHKRVYGRFPQKQLYWVDDQVRRINVYTRATSPETLDAAIHEALGQQEEQ